MLLRNLIKDTIPPLKTTDTAVKALQWMQEFRHSNLPVINENVYMGMVYESDLMKLENKEVPLFSLSMPVNRLFVNEYQHIFDAIKFAANNDFTIIPVLNDQEQYLGLVTVMDIIHALAEANSVQNPGGIVVLEVDKNKYTLSEISSIVESEGAQILSSSALVTADPNIVEVTLKINKIDLTRILAGFYRRNLEVKASYHQSEFQQDMQSRYDAFMNYLKM
ncbi:MAG: CBS domain-containing protein [Bacteroidetes bacterium]|jgi:predicted transcriptional regulator|nr:CBS domain-containing protein [Bacteroidota bacterium]